MASILVVSGIFMFLFPVVLFFMTAEPDDDVEVWLMGRPFNQIFIISGMPFVGMLFMNAGVILR